MPTPVGMKPISLNDAPSTTNTPLAIMSAMKNNLPSGETRMSCGIPPFERRMYPSTLRSIRSIFVSPPWNSHVKIA